MLSSDIILGTGNKEFITKEGKVSSGILTQDCNFTPCGSPVIVAITKNETVGCVNPFPARANRGCGFAWTPTHIITLIDKKPINKTHTVKNIEEFNYRKFDLVKETVKNQGGISFISKEKSNVQFILNSIKSIIGEYKHSSLFHYNIAHGQFLSGEDDNLINVFSFFDLSHCVPLFNLRKLDGLGISFSQVLRKHSELVGRQVNALRLDIVVSNYKDNLFIIDGTNIDQKYEISNSIYKEIKGYTKVDIPIKKDKLKATLTKPNKKGRIPSHRYGNIPSEAPYSGDVEAAPAVGTIIVETGETVYNYSNNTFTSSTDDF